MQTVTRTPEQIVCFSLCNTNIIKTVYDKQHNRSQTSIIEFPSDTEAYDFYKEVTECQ